MLIGVAALPYASGQVFSNKEIKILRSKEDSLTRLGDDMIDEENPADRLKADSIFTRMLVRTLQVKNSFQYPLDSLYTISKLYSPDSNFRIITWQIRISDENFRQRGAIQMKTENGSLKLFPLIDYSDLMENMKDTITDHLHWPGAVYYRIIKNEHNGKSVYTLLGYDEYNARSNRKIIEILQFEEGMPRFGKMCFVPLKQARHIMEYKKSAGPKLNYDEEMGLIVMENLISSTGEPFKKNTLVGDGDYDGFQWENGQWILIRKLFKAGATDTELPVPAPYLEDKLNLNIPQEMNKENDPKKPETKDKKAKRKKTEAVN